MERVKKRKREKMERLLKKEVGITLIALVITIIVLLILAGVSIAMLIGDNGILTQASRAKEQTGIGEEKEQIALAYNGAITEKEGNTGVVADDMNLQFEKNGTNAQAKENIKVYFLDSKRWYKIDSNGNVTGPYESEEEIGTSLVEMFKKAQSDGCEGGDTCTNREEHLHIGDYVAYNPIATGDTGTEDKYEYESKEVSNGHSDQLYTVNNDTEKVNWIVLGLSENENNLLITTGTPIRGERTNNPDIDTPYFYLYGSTGYINAETELNNISKIYGNGDFAQRARSITIEDINKLTGFNPEIYSEYGYGDNVEIKGNGDGTYNYKFLNNGWSGTFESKYGFYYFDDNNNIQKIEINDTTTVINLTNTFYEYDVQKYVNERIYNKFFNHEVKSYWLSSNYTDISGGAVYGIRCVDNNDLFNSRELAFASGRENIEDCGIRPVITIKPEVTVKDMPILEEQEEPQWNVGPA